MLKRWRRPLALGAAGLTACLVVDIAIALGVASAGSAAVVLDPIAGVLIAAAIGLVIVTVIRTRRRRGICCGETGCTTKTET